MSSDRISVYRQFSRSASGNTGISENLPPRTIARLAREVRNLQKNPPEGVRLVVDEESGLPANLGELMVSPLQRQVDCFSQIVLLGVSFHPGYLCCNGCRTAVLHTYPE